MFYNSNLTTHSVQETGFTVSRQKTEKQTVKYILLEYMFSNIVYIVSHRTIFYNKYFMKHVFVVIFIAFSNQLRNEGLLAIEQG